MTRTEARRALWKLAAAGALYQAARHDGTNGEEAIRRATLMVTRWGNLPVRQLVDRVDMVADSVLGALLGYLPGDLWDLLGDDEGHEKRSERGQA